MIAEDCRIFLKVILVLERPSETRCWTSNGFFNVCDLPVFFQCSPKTQFLDHKCQDLSWTTLVFSKNRPGMEKHYQKNKTSKSYVCYYRENELIHWGYILKSSPTLGCSRKGFYF